MGGHDAAQAQKDMELMKKATAGGVALVGVLCVINVGIHMSHEHSHDAPPLYSYRKIRAKAFPWGNNDCDLFDTKCDDMVKAKF
jgi:hypothetical protein